MKNVLWHQDVYVGSLCERRDLWKTYLGNRTKMLNLLSSLEIYAKIKKTKFFSVMRMLDPLPTLGSYGERTWVYAWVHCNHFRVQGSLNELIVDLDNAVIPPAEPRELWETYLGNRTKILNLLSSLEIYAKIKTKTKFFIVMRMLDLLPWLRSYGQRTWVYAWVYCTRV